MKIVQIFKQFNCQIFTKNSTESGSDYYDLSHPVIGWTQGHLGQDPKKSRIPKTQFSQSFKVYKFESFKYNF